MALPGHTSTPTTPGTGKQPDKAPMASTTSKRQAHRRPLVGLHRSQRHLEELPIKRATLWSLGMHVFGPFALAGLLAIVLLILSLIFNIPWMDWFKSEPKKPDMVFALVPDTQAKRPETAKFKGQFNQEAGGRNNPKQPVAPPDKPQQQTRQTPEQPRQQQAEQPKPAQPRPKAAPKAVKPLEPKPVSKPAIPLPAEEEAISGPLVPDGVISEAISNTQPGQSGANQGSQASGSPSSGMGELGNPEGGPGKRPGVNVQQDTDYGPFMSELSRRIKRNWTAPRNLKDRRTILLFSVTRDGQLTSVEVQTTSGDTVADEAAVRAVQASAPFRNVPPFAGDVLPILFTFDYTVFTPGNAKRR